MPLCEHGCSESKQEGHGGTPQGAEKTQPGYPSRTGLASGPCPAPRDSTNTAAHGLLASASMTWAPGLCPRQGGWEGNAGSSGLVNSPGADGGDRRGEGLWEPGVRGRSERG